LKDNARYIALNVLTEVLQSHISLSDSLEQHLPMLADKRERALAQELSYGVMRWLPRLQAILKLLLTKPFKSRDRDLEVVLLLGLYQQLYLRIPPHAAISATVELSKLLHKNWATKLINAVLRTFQRDNVVLLQQLEHNQLAQYAHPLWLLKQLQADWPQHWQQIINANNQAPPMDLRINLQQITRAEYLSILAERGITAHPHPYNEVGIRLDQAMDVQLLPNFNAGWVSVQDGAAQLAADLLQVDNSMRVLDNCAAPGGKTAHILEVYRPKTLVALDYKTNRIAQLQHNLQRLALNAQVLQADATKPESWWNGEQFERILLDVPCSATGVIRRHPDIKYLRQRSDIAKLVQHQAALLKSSWQLLKPNGILVYATCSVVKAENEQQIQSFISAQADAIPQPITVDWGHTQTIGCQILPGDKEGFDGFYYAILLKKS
jgi:16S rRNA (cytosine967-C5)-methyltransferase